MPIQYRYISQQAEWDAVASEFGAAPRLAVDTERNGRYSYRERICLIQISDGAQTVLVDPLAVHDLTALGDILHDPRVVKAIHGSEEDIRFFHRDFGFAVDNLFDTGMAARFLGVARPNLGAVLEEFSGVVIPKDPKLQMSHWGLRPLPRAALDYAAGDVHHMLPLVDELEYRLAKAGRTAWVEEECERVARLRFPPEEPPETAYRRIKGWDSLTPRQITILREIYVFRDDKACVWDIPIYQAASNDDLFVIAQADGMVERGVGGLLANRCFGELREVIERAIDGPEDPKPQPETHREPWPAERRERLKFLKAWRTRVSQELDLAVSHIWPTPSLERIASGPESLAGEMADGHAEVRRWQQQEFGAELAEMVDFWRAEGF